jgi:hypothetical protein
MALPIEVPLSKSIAEPLLSYAEIGLVILAGVIVVGLIGEYSISRHETRSIPPRIEYSRSLGRKGRPIRRFNWLLFWTWIVIGGIIGELFCDAAIWESSESLKIISDKELKNALALAGPRDIRSREDIEEIKHALSPFRGTPYDLTIPPIIDRFPFPRLLEPGSSLILHLIVSLKMSGWELRSVEGSIPKAVLPWQIASFLGSTSSRGDRSIPTILIGQLDGVRGIVIPLPTDDKLSDIAGELAHALKRINLETDFDLPPPYNNIKNGMLTNNVIHIVIGTKN